VRIGVISDTHLPRFGRALPSPLLRGFELERIERIIHCGDWMASFAVDLVEAVAPFEGVAGNNDPPEIALRLGHVKVVDLAGARIGITHGHLGPRSWTSPRRAVAAFDGVQDLAAICFGHSHIPLVLAAPGAPLLINPGSPTDKRRQPRYSWVLLEVRGGRVHAELRFFD